MTRYSLYSLLYALHRSYKPSDDSKMVNETRCSKREMLEAVDGYMFLDYNTTGIDRRYDETFIDSGKTRQQWWKKYNATKHATVYGQVMTNFNAVVDPIVTEIYPLLCMKYSGFISPSLNKCEVWNIQVSSVHLLTNFLFLSGVILHFSVCLRRGMDVCPSAR